MNATDKAEALRLKIDQRFRSGNSVPVERAYITAEEWEALRSLLSAQGESEPSADQNVEAVRAKLLDRSRRGIEKYGTTTERNDLSLRDWLVHMQEELLDAAVYIQAAMRKGQEPSAEHGWIPMTTRPKDGQRIVYWFEPFNTAAIGTYHSGLPSDPESFDTVSGRNGFTTVDPECPWWMPTPTDEQRARELARQGVGNG